MLQLLDHWGEETQRIPLDVFRKQSPYREEQHLLVSL